MKGMFILKFSLKNNSVSSHRHTAIKQNVSFKATHPSNRSVIGGKLDQIYVSGGFSAGGSRTMQKNVFWLIGGANSIMYVHCTILCRK